MTWLRERLGTLDLKDLSRAGGWGRRGYGLDVLDDGVDLRRLEIVAGARHAGRAVADVFADKFFVAAQGFARQHRSVLPGSLLHHGVADTAGLAEQAQPFPLGVVERRIGRALSENSRRRRHQERRNKNASSHCYPPNL